MRILVFSFESNGVQMTIFPLSNPLNENEIKMKYVPVPLRPLRAGEKGETTIPSFHPKGKKCLRGNKCANKNILPPLPPIIPSVFTPIHFSCFSCVKKRESGNSLRGKYKKVDPASSQSSYSVPFFKTLIRPLLVR
jgi:hypothetical protein